MGQQRNRISTNNESFEESNQYTSPVRSQSQSNIQVNNNEVENKRHLNESNSIFSFQGNRP